MMAKGSSMCRRKGPSRLKPLKPEPECSSHSAKALTDGNNNHHLDQSIKQAIQRRGGKQVKAFVVMALHDDGDISTHTTDLVQQCTDSIFASDAGDCLRYAHRSSVRKAQSSNVSDDQDLVSSSPFDECNTNNAALKNGSVKHLAAKQTPAVQPPRFGEEDKSTEETLDEPSSSERRSGALQSFKICESSKIEAFLGKRLRALQQLAVKRVAKAWIKGICPKKQATFPYHKKKREREGLDHLNDFSGYIPGWWPDTSICRFVEPDHIKRDERINLCLHLLRLRPTPAQLQEWNKGCTPHQTHVTKGWTEFLRELAPPSIFDDMREPDGKTEERSRLMAQIYELARKEEAFFNGDIDGNDRYWWHTEVADAKSAPKKTARRSYDSSVDDSDMESDADSARPSKRSKKASQATSPSHSPETAQIKDIDMEDRMQDCKPGLIDERPVLPRPMFQAYPTDTSCASPQRQWSQQVASDTKPSSIQYLMHERSHIRPSAPRMPQAYSMDNSWAANSPPAPYDTSTTSSGKQNVSQAFAMGVPTSTYPGRHDYQFSRHGTQPPATMDQACPAYMTSQIPQPYLDNIPVGSMYPLQAPIHSPNVTAEEQPQMYNGALYYGQPANAQSQFASIPGTPTTNPQLDVSAAADMSFRPCTPGSAQCYALDPTDYQYPPHTAYQYSDVHHGDDFTAPARVERGFTGHGSGVGGGAHT